MLISQISVPSSFTSKKIKQYDLKRSQMIVEKKNTVLYLEYIVLIFVFSLGCYGFVDKIATAPRPLFRENIT